ncbi:MAG: hypothetical protein KI790_03530 [Cyclobacteriaceae bacterium]|nr:hypothetical protein [Cyclobacteriaceae bacterium HetDA_MAG_MS6]
MKRLILLVSLLAVIPWISAFDSVEIDESQKVIAAVRSLYKQQVQEFELKAKHFNAQAKQSTDVKTLKHHFEVLRKSYKKAETLLEYYDPEFVKDFINGPPIPSLERNAPGPFVVTPEGMQVIDELLYGDHPDLVELQSFSQKLLDNAISIKRSQSGVVIQHRHILEAARLELIRIMSLGITGFDTPGSTAGVVESKYALEGIKELFQPYEDIITKKQPRLWSELMTLLDGAIVYIGKNQNFEKFDRAHFIRNFGNPLYAHLLEIHKRLGIETYYEVNNINFKHAINYFEDNIFDSDFLNPAYYQTVHSSKNNENVVSLGKTLFFDPALSADNKRSCASCHQPDKAFTDGHPKSIAKDFKGVVSRNAPTLINAVYADKFFYDLRSSSPEAQVDHVIASHQEFSTSYLAVTKKLAQSAEYTEMFARCFPELGAEPIQKFSLTAAISVYVSSLKGLDSPFDQYMRGESEVLPKEAIQGFNVFMGKAACGTCHFAPVFNGLVPPQFHESESEVLGVPATADIQTLDEDEGRYDGVTKDRAYIYRHSFKTTTVRNAAVTGPYMHNGVFASLEDVMDFYNKGGGEGHGLKVTNQTLAAAPLNLSKKEISQVISFIKSLTDTNVDTSGPEKLPVFPEKYSSLNDRKIGGDY